MHVLVIADFGVDFTTGSHLARALELNGHEATRINERPEIWRSLWAEVINDMPDFILWNSTPGYAPAETYGDQRALLQHARCPVVYYHLDLYWGLPQREAWFDERPSLQGCDLYCTADGGHDERWAERGLEHVWFPPAVLAADCTPGVFREEYAADIAFVGSWMGGYHEESKHRYQLIEFLRCWSHANPWYTVRFWPKLGQHAVRGQDLNDLYASTKVVVGDSCMVPHLNNYWSDRVPETTGRGGLLLHPRVQGLQHFHPWVQTWEAGNWDALDSMIAVLLEGSGDEVRKMQQAETLESQTYEIRMNQLVELLQERKML